jgi:DNA-binding transcriptional MerR regulator
VLDIGDVARRAGVRPSTLRYYEDVGLLTSAGRAGGRRQYDEAVLGRLDVIAFAKDAGFTLAEIRDLLSGPGHATAGRHALTRRKLDEVNAHIRRAEAMRSLLEASLACHCEALEECPAIRS